MDEPRAQRTLVKSPPELWAEVSDVGALARRLGEFGEISITRLEPETAVAWEGDRARGTVQLEPSGWGTRVTLTAQLAERGDEAADEAAQDAAADGAAPPDAREDDGAEQAAPPVGAEPSAAAAHAAAAPGKGFWARLTARWRRRRAVAAEPEAAPIEEEPAPVEQEPAPASEPILDAAPEPEPEGQPGPEGQPDSQSQSESRAGSDGEGEPALDAARAAAILSEVLDDLGTAHHRPFSRLS